MRRIALSLTIIIALLNIANTSQAQVVKAASPTTNVAAASQMNGTWYGTLEGYTYGESRRTLTVTGNQCMWEEPGKGSSPVSCDVTSASVSLITGAGSRVSLVLSGATLNGTFMLKNNQVFKVSMGRTPIEIPATGNLTASCLSTFGGKSYVGTIKNGTRYFQFGRTVTYTFASRGELTVVGGKPVCVVSVTYETDAKDVGSKPDTYYFDGQVAVSGDLTRRGNWMSFTVTGGCLVQDGQFFSHSAAGGNNNRFRSNEGDSTFCPR